MLLTDMVVWTEARFSGKDSLFRVRGTTQSSPDIRCYRWLSAPLINKGAVLRQDIESGLLLWRITGLSAINNLLESSYICDLKVDEEVLSRSP